MYQKIGQKIMGLVKRSLIFTVVSCVILELYIIIEAPELWIYGLAAFVVICSISYVNTWLMYGFGQLIDDVHALRRKSEQADEYDNDELPRL